MGRKRAFPWRRRFAPLLLLVAVTGGGWGWLRGQLWRPPAGEYPVQGVLVGSGDGTVNFRAFAAVGARFAYLEASEGADARDPAFARNLRSVRDSRLSYGALHRYDPCIPAERQAANFITTVPRDGDLLPPAIALDRLAEDCPERVSEAAVESELTTFLNQIEGHSGKPALLKLSPAFEERDELAARLERNLWLARDWLQPDYAGRPRTLWTANSSYRNEASEEPVRWVVVQP